LHVDSVAQLKAVLVEKAAFNEYTGHRLVAGPAAVTNFALACMGHRQLGKQKQPSMAAMICC